MIRLMGLSVRDAQHPLGDIAIEYVGLRPGEKLREELLLGDNTQGTEHPRIAASREPLIPAARLEQELNALREAIRTNDGVGMRDVLLRVVEGFQPDGTPRAEAGAPSLISAEPASRAIH
jgi:FlaA1/EpsC-like NDP-sugar epimerase